MYTSLTDHVVITTTTLTETTTTVTETTMTATTTFTTKKMKTGDASNGESIDVEVEGLLQVAMDCALTYEYTNDPQVKQGYYDSLWTALTDEKPGPKLFVNVTNRCGRVRQLVDRINR